MSRYLFTPPAPVAAPIRGRDELFPIHRIFCVGRNYAAHAREMGAEPDREAPFYFNKSAHHYVPSGSTIPYASETANFQYEMELVVAIGTGGFRIAAADALDHVFGYACGLDMTRRDIQFALREKQRPWDLAKDFENAAVLSEIVPASITGHPGKGLVRLKLNGEVKQSGDLSDLIHPVPALIAHLSRFYHLQPGDIIYTGTPEGVGPVKPGDRLEGMVEGVGNIALAIGPAE
ncbi:fumarylacetoacetate hydrolase family protein [Parvibaculum sp.]|uniref:fumarylacetoacetate hydrolase family protein n=1 Tax=Parvibaculum sp. TaxID=2024848 RepID=UPI00320C7502